MCVGTHWDTEGPAESKVGNLDGSLVVDEQVLGFEVTVDDTARVHEHDALQDLVRVALGWRNTAVRVGLLHGQCMYAP